MPAWRDRCHSTTALLIALIVSIALVEAASQAPRSFKGTVVDASAGVLPGVTVVAQAPDGRSLATTVTNEVGEFTFEGLPPGKISLLFHLDGFADAKATITIPPEGAVDQSDSARFVQRLELSGFSETVTVRGDPPPPPPRVLAPVPEHDPASVCGPAKAEGIVPAFGSIKSLRTGAAKRLFAAGDELLIDTGILNLLKVGENFVVRRRFPTMLIDSRNRVTMGEHSAGLLQIAEVDGPIATAVIIYACDEMVIGDYLAPFRPEPVQQPHPAGLPVFDKAARLLFADAGQMLGSTNRLLVMAHGARDGVRTGQRWTIFRRTLAAPAPVILGEATVVAVRRESATIRVDRAIDVIFLGENGDWVAPQRSPAPRKD